MFTVVSKTAIGYFKELGIKGVEFTGGGDPTLYKNINELLEYTSDIGLHIGVNTNAVDSQLIKNWGLCDWVRVSLNVLDYKPFVNDKFIRDSGTTVTYCYIWNDISTLKTFEKVVVLANKLKIPCRVAPDCIKTLDEIDSMVKYLKMMLDYRFHGNEYVFVSDFNITTHRENNKCFIHMIKPCLYTDGNVYACPSAELALENNYQVAEKAKICHWKDIKNFYTGKGAIDCKMVDCSYCKYEKQQRFLEEVLTETTFNEFA